MNSTSIRRPLKVRRQFSQLHKLPTTGHTLDRGNTAEARSAGRTACSGCAGIARLPLSCKTSKGRESSKRRRQSMAKSRKEQIEEMLAEDPGDAFLRYGLAMEHVGAGDDAGAVACFRKLLEVDPKYVP